MIMISLNHTLRAYITHSTLSFIQTNRVLIGHIVYGGSTHTTLYICNTHREDCAHCTWLLCLHLQNMSPAVWGTSHPLDADDVVDGVDVVVDVDVDVDDDVDVDVDDDDDVDGCLDCH